MKSSFITILVFSAMNFVISMAASVFGGILDQIALSLDITVASAGLLNTMYLYGAAFGVPITLIIFRKINRIRLLKVMLIISILATVALVTVKSFEALLIVRLIMGIALNSYSVLTVSLAMSLTEKERQGRAMAFLIAGGSLAMMVGIPLTRALSSILAWTDIFWILNAMMVAALIYFQFNLTNGSSNLSALNLRNELNFLKDGKILYLLAFTMVMFLGYGSFYTYITPYLLEQYPTLEPVMSVILAAIGVASFIGNWIGGIVSDRIGYARSMLLGAVIHLVIIILLFVFQSVQWATLLFAILWVMNSWFIGLQVSTGAAQVTENKSSFIISLNTTVNLLGQAVGASLAAVVITLGGIQNIVFISLLTNLLITLIQFVSNKKYL